MKTRIFKTAEMTPDLLDEAARALTDGAVAVFPTDTVYGIGANAFNEASISRIYDVKDRPPVSALQILTGTVAQARAVTRWSARAQKLADAFWPGALTLILPAAPEGEPLLRGFAALGLRVPGHAFLTDLLARMGAPLASTSANLHGKPTLTREEEILETFDSKVDFIFLGGALSPIASSVVTLAETEPRLLREAAVSRARLEAVLGEKVY